MKKRPSLLAALLLGAQALSGGRLLPDVSEPEPKRGSMRDYALTPRQKRARAAARRARQARKIERRTRKH
ncbi:MAG: hypothetical protein NW241_10935 [Bacteroidia bacterium]|nr:hypothetical protein [Bacteroidia bacterium]